MSDAVDKPKVPKLRFPEFEREWQQATLGDFFTFKNGVNADKSMYGSGRKFINVMDVIADAPINHDAIIGSVEISDKEFSKNEVVYGDILFQRSSETREEVGQSNVYLDDRPVTFGGFVIRGRPKVRIDPLYFDSLLKTASVRKDMTSRSGGSTRYNIGQDALELVQVRAANDVEEQRKVADFLGELALRTLLLERQREALLSYKKGMMQRLFSQELRFTRDDGNPFSDWQEKRLGEVFDRVTKRNAAGNLNVLTISAQLGLINQREFFNKSVAANDVTGYYLLQRGDFAYNKSYSAGYPLGAIKRLKRYDAGVVSTLYICFRAKNVCEVSFYEHYFDYGGLNREIHKIAQEGARNHGLLNMSVIEFFRDIQIPRPHPDEQQKIADFLSALDAKIDAVTRQIDAMQRFKKGLLQQMFV